jgi:hypothetical protein
VSIKRFVWTTHAEDRRTQRLLDSFALERAIRDSHTDRQINPGAADWLLNGLLADGRHFGAVYDHPYGSDHEAVLIVSVWDY